MENIKYIIPPSVWKHVYGGVRKTIVIYLINSRYYRKPMYSGEERMDYVSAASVGEALLTHKRTRKEPLKPEELSSVTLAVLQGKVRNR